MFVTQPLNPKRRRDEEYKDLVRYANDTYYLRYWSPKLRREIERSLGTKIKARALKARKRILENIADEKDRHSIAFKTFAPVIARFKDQKNWKAENTKIAAFIQIDKHLSPWFGNYDPARVNNELWVRYATERRAKDPECSLFNAHKYLSAILGWAHAEGIVRKKIKLESFEQHRESPGRVVTPVEFAAVFDHLSSEYKDIALIAWEMGMRINEIKMLGWDRVNFATGEIILRKIDTKNRRARRPVMTPKVKVILERRANNGSLWVFPSKSDKTRHYSVGDQIWQKAKALAGVQFRFHDIRHTWLTNAFKKSNRYAEICEYAGLDLREAIGTYVDFSVDDMKAISKLHSGITGEEVENG
jgi:integrase